MAVLLLSDLYWEQIIRSHPCMQGETSCLSSPDLVPLQPARKTQCTEHPLRAVHWGKQMGVAPAPGRLAAFIWRWARIHMLNMQLEWLFESEGLESELYSLSFGKFYLIFLNLFLLQKTRGDTTYPYGLVRINPASSKHSVCVTSLHLCVFLPDLELAKTFACSEPRNHPGR